MQIAATIMTNIADCFTPTAFLHRLVAGADSGGERAAAMYALIGAAKLNGLDPEACLCYVLVRIAEHLINRNNDLLPWNLAGDLSSSSLTHDRCPQY